MSELKQKLEALLFSSGKSMSLEELSRLCRKSQDEIEKVLKELQYDYNQRDSSIMVVNEGKNWKLITKEKYLDVVKNIVTQTELTKSVMETLAAIAFRYPIKQSDLIKIRSNKAYDHLKQLEELGYISRQKHGRTKLIKLTQKFFDYFDLPPEKLKEKFHDFESIAKAIEKKEKEIERIKEGQKQKAEEAKQKQEEEKKKIEKEIDLIDDEGHKVKLEVVDEKPVVAQEAKIEIEKEKLGSLEVFDEPEEEKEEQQEDTREEKAEVEEEQTEVSEEELDEKEEKKILEEDEFEGGEGIKTTPEMEKEIEKRVEEMTHPEKEETEEEQETEEDTDEKSVPSDSEADKTQ